MVIHALAYLSVMRIALWTGPFRRLQRTVPIAPRTTGPSPDRLAWAITAAAACVPRSTCLVRALAAQRLFARHGHRSDLRIGVAKSAEAVFEAHAWLESDGRTLVGASQRQYNAFASFCV